MPWGSHGSLSRASIACARTGHLSPAAAREAEELVELIHDARHRARVAALARLRKIDDHAATWHGTTRETRAIRAQYEPLYREELEARRAVVARRLRKFARRYGPAALPGARAAELLEVTP